VAGRINREVDGSTEFADKAPPPGREFSLPHVLVEGKGVRHGRKDDD